MVEDDKSSLNVVSPHCWGYTKRSLETHAHLTFSADSLLLLLGNTQRYLEAVAYCRFLRTPCREWFGGSDAMGPPVWEHNTVPMQVPGQEEGTDIHKLSDTEN